MFISSDMNKRPAGLPKYLTWLQDGCTLVKRSSYGPVWLDVTMKTWSNCNMPKSLRCCLWHSFNRVQLNFFNANYLGLKKLFSKKLLYQITTREQNPEEMRQASKCWWRKEMRSMEHEKADGEHSAGPWTEGTIWAWGLKCVHLGRRDHGTGGNTT